MKKFLSKYTLTPKAWSPHCATCGESVVPGTDLDGRVVEYCTRCEVESITTVQRRKL
jgi:hypothetical protein